LVAAHDSAKLLPSETTGHKAPNAWRFGRLCFCDSIDISAADQETLFVEHAMTQVEHVEEEQDNLPKATATIEDAGAARKRIKLDIPEERIKGKLNDAFGELQRDAVLPGFRRGRAPKRLIEKRFGGDMRNTVKQQLVAEAYEKAVEENKLDAIGDPEIDLTKVELPESGNLTVSIEVEVSPEFALPSIEKIAVKRPKLEANEERLNLAIENLRKYFGNWHDTTEPAKEADTVVADAKATSEDGEIIAEQPQVTFTVKPGSIAGVKFDDLGDKLTGATIGTTVHLEATAPQDHPDEKLRGKKIKVELAIKGIKHQHLPEVNEEFGQMLGFDSVDALKADLKERLVTQLEQETKGAMAQQIYRYLLSHTSLDLPAKLSQRQMGNVLRRRATELMQKGVPESEIVHQIDQLRISSAQQAAVDLRLFFILGKLADQFGIDVNEEEVNTRIAAIATQYGRRPEKLRSQMSASNQIEQLYLQIRDGKVVDKLLETAEIADVDEKTLAEEFKNLPPLSNIGPNVTGVSHATPAPEKKAEEKTEEKAEPKAEKKPEKKKSEKKSGKK
jgi:trigger factor